MVPLAATTIELCMFRSSHDVERKLDRTDLLLATTPINLPRHDPFVASSQFGEQTACRARTHHKVIPRAVTATGRRRR
jgi:hypothetical protein